MEIPGTLFTYDEETRLTAFETGPQESGKTVVFIGGLGDLYNAVPFLFPLQTTLSEMGFSLIQVQLSSSVLGYGTSSLKQDAFELDLLVDHLLEKRKKKTIVFLGHSTGCQDCYRHNKYGRNSSHVAGYILQAPVSDRLYFTKNLPEFNQMLSLAKKLASEDKLDELLPRMKMMAPMTVRRFLSLNTLRGDDDVFSPDLTDEDIKSIFKAVTRPMCWVYGDDDEFYVALNNEITLESIMRRFQAICPLIEMTDIVPEGDHLLRKEKSQLYFCQTVKRFIEHLNV